MPFACSNSLTCWNPRSASPAARTSAICAPEDGCLVFAFNCSPTPSFEKASTICRPLVPEDATMVRADKSAAFRASTVETSTLAADAGTATPMLERAKSVHVPPASLPSLDCRSMFCAALTTTSTTSPSATRLVMASVPVQATRTLCPVACSNTEIASETDSLAAFGANTLISAAITEQASPSEVSRRVAIRQSILPPGSRCGCCTGRMP